ncbi:sulfatase-like hydrolase/transferase, partial [bacterium]|nr:sulfatase-like hydrolase/transferase [bacterium]
GSPIGRTPHLDRLARRGIQFEAAYTASPLTLPSHATMLTGLTPPAHGARSNSTFRMADDVATLAGALSERGFATGAFLASATLDHRFGTARGFDVYDDDVGRQRSAFGMAQRPGDVVVDAATAWLGALPAGSRRFEWVHLFDAHDPYTAPRPLVTAAGGSVYLADVSLADAMLGRRLRARERSDDPSWVVVLGDHGESLGEHREETHGLFVYGATMRIPAVIHPAPRGEARGLRRAVLRTIDLPATAFGLLGLDADDAPGEGEDALGGDTGPVFMESIYAYLHYGWSSLRAVIDGRWKYIEAPTPELYDLENDPGETRNVEEEHPERAAELAELLESIAADVAAQSMELDDASREALESLGYITTIVDVGDSDRPDPKDMVRVNELVMLATRASAGGQFVQARQYVARALDLDPDNKELHRTMGVVLSAEGRYEAAVGWLLRCLELPPDTGDAHPHAQLGICYLRLDRPDEARRHLEKALELEPDRAPTWSNLGLARRRQGDEAGAREAWRRALELDPELESARQFLRE